MENTIKISFSAVTHIGSACTVNDNRIFSNGRFLHPCASDCSQVSLEVNDKKCFFAISENMEDEESGISLTSDLRKFHQKAVSSSKDIHIKLDELVQCIEQSTNLLHSVSLGENDFRERKPSFAGILIDEGSIAAVNLGNCRIYKLEGDTFKLLVNDYKRAERLLKMGIISNEQAEMLSGQQKSLLEEGRTTVKKSDISTLREGIVYLICSNGLTESVSEDTIYDILASNRSSDEAASQLVMEAVKNESEENITALVLKVEDAGAGQVQQPGPRAAQYRSASGRITPRHSRIASSKHRQSIDIGKIVSMAVLVLLAAAVLFGGFKLWGMLRNPESKDAVAQQGSTLPEDTAVEEPPFSDIEEDPEGNELPVEDNTVPENGTESEVPSADPESSTTSSDLVGPEGTTHIVKAGDMLMLLAKKYYGDESKYTLIMEANGITDPNKIAVGQKLTIPPKN